MLEKIARRAVTFDFHDTLIHCDAWFQLEIAHLPAEIARRLPDVPLGSTALTATYRALRAEIIAHGRELDSVDGVLETFKRHAIVLERADIEPIVQQVFQPLVSDSHVVMGARETLRYLHERGVPLGVVSSAVHHDFLEWALARHELRPYVQVVVSSARAGFYKTRPELFRAACAQLDVEPSASVHVGDSFRFDHLGAAAAGLRTVWLNARGGSAADGAPAPDLELATLEGAGPHIHELVTRGPTSG